MLVRETYEGTDEYGIRGVHAHVSKKLMQADAIQSGRGRPAGVSGGGFWIERRRTHTMLRHVPSRYAPKVFSSMEEACASVTESMVSDESLE